MTNRLFFAIEINDEWRQELSAIMEKLHNESWGKQIHWTSPENLHLTLRFLGNCQPERIPLIKQTVEKAVKASKPFSVQASTVHLFPSTQQPHIIAVGVQPNPDLFDLQLIVDKTVIASGFGAERHGFFPHFTLGRIPPHQKINLPDNISLKLKPLAVNKIVLFNSNSAQNKQIYTPLQHFNLIGTVQPQVCVGAIVMRENKILLVKRKNEPHRGLWAIPGGKVEAGETLQQAAEREIMEETGIHIKAKEPLFIFDLIQRDENNILQLHYVIIDLDADYISGEISVNDESEDAGWISADECKKLSLTPSTKKFLAEKIFRGKL